MPDQFVPNSEISLPELVKQERMSVRSYNICKTAGLHSLSAILDYYSKNNTFTNLRNAGRLTEIELVGICHKYREFQEGPEQPIVSDIDELSTAKLKDLSVDQLATIEHQFQLRLEKLSVRSQNLLKNIAPRIDANVVRFEEFFADPQNQKIHKFTNAGRVTIDELLKLRTEMLQLASDISDGVTEESIFNKNIALWKRCLSLSDKDVYKYRKDFLVRRFPLFRFLQQLFDKKIGLEEREFLIMKHRSRYYLDCQKLPYEEIAGQLDLTRERVRQLASKIPSKIHALIATVGFVYEFINYETLNDSRRDVIVVDKELVECINTREGVAFTSLFYVSVFAVLLKESHDRVDRNLDDATEYLVHRELTTVFAFDLFLLDLDERSNSRIPETYTLVNNEHIKTFWIGENYEHLRRVSAICELLACDEFGIDLDSDGNFVFSRNTPRRMHELISDILAESGKPMHVEKISAVLNRRFPKFLSTPNSVRSNLLIHDCFCRYEASSIYGLREWETQNADLKSGTFSDIAEQFLREASGPCHQYDVADFVLQYRDSTRYNILSTLKADSLQRFKFLNDGMIGLVDENYSGTSPSLQSIPEGVVDALTQLIEANGNHVSLARLIDYCVLHYRMPEQQAQLLFEQSIRDGTFELLDNAVVGIPVAKTPKS